NKVGFSHFMTEKFGTITLIKKKGKGETKDKQEIKYELTPLRTENDYEDFRHPGEITRSNDVLLDSNRRDFTINCMYYTNVAYTTEYTSLIDKKNIHNYADDETFLKRLDDHGYLYIKDTNLLIVQDHKHIVQLFTEGKFQAEHLMTMLKSATVFTLGKKPKDKSLKLKALRILVDPHKGIHDSIHRKLKAVGESDIRFTEDALRIIRAIRFVNVINEKLKISIKPKVKGNGIPQSGTESLKPSASPVVLFDFDKETRKSIKKNHELVKNVAKERIKEEIMKAFTVGNPFGFVALLDEAKILPILFPALAETKNVEQPIRYHPFDVYVHTLLTLFELQKISIDPLVRLAMLYHDVGKVDQFSAYGENLSKEEIRAIIAGPLNHRRSSPEYAKEDFHALGFSSKEITSIARYIAHHHKLEEILYALPEKREKKIRQFLSEAGVEKFRNILDITIADRMGQFNPLQNSSDITDIDKIRKIMERLHKQEGQFTMKQLAVSGEDIMKQCKLNAGPKIGELLKKTLARVIDDIKKRNTKKDIFAFLGTQLKQLK
ncbi:MAG: HD domain-containing protein, partial [Candidatus Absconditabacterales bacterium]